MAISFVAASAVVTGANPTVAIPAGYAKDDLLLLVTTGTATPTTPSGWTSLAAQGATSFITVLYKYATASEASVAVTLTGSTSKSVMLAYRGAGAFQVSATFLTGTSTAPSTNTTTTTYANDYVVSIYANTSGAARTFTANASTTSRVNSATTTTVQGLLVADELKATAGVTTARAATLSLSSAWSGLQIAFIESRTVYWVGGNGTWASPGAGTTGANWADSSGGAGGKIVPTQNDAVVVDASSGSPTITLSAVPACASLTTTGATCTLSSTGTLTLNGGMTLSATTTWSASGTITAVGTGTITTNGVSIASPITINGISQTVTLGSALTTTGALTLTNGTLTLNGFDANCLTFSGTGTTARGIAFGSNYVNLTRTGSSGTLLNLSNATLFTPSGTGGFKLSGADTSGFTRTANIGTTGGSVATAPNLFVSAGAAGSAVAISTSSWVGDLNFTGFSGTYTPDTLTIAGSLTLSSSMTLNGINSETTTFAATSTGKTITLAGKSSYYSFSFNGVGGGWTFQDAPTISRDFGVANGTVNANNFNVSALTYTLSGGSIIMGSGTWAVTATGAGTQWNNTGTAITANTSTITLATTSSLATTFAGGGRTYYNLSLIGATATGAFIITGANTFNTLSSSRTGIYTITLPSSTTTTVANWSISGANATTNYFTLNSSTPGVQATLSVASGTVNPGFAQIQDSNATGGATFSASSAFNLGNNTGWSFNSNRYWVGGAGTWSSSNTANWAFTSGGAGGAWVPTVTEDVFFNSSSGAAGSVTVSGNNPIKTLTTTGSSFTFSSSGAISVAGDVTLSGTTTLSMTGDLRITGAGTITPNGATINEGLIINAPGATVTLGGDLVLSTTSGTFTLTAGTFNTNNFNVTADDYVITGTTARTLTMGSGTFTVTGIGTGWDATDPTNLTLNANTSTITFTATSSTETFVGGGKTYYNLAIAGGANTSAFIISGANTFNTLSSSRTGSYTVRLPAGVTTTVANWSIAGTSVSTNFVSLISSTAGTQATLSVASGTVNPGYAYIQDSNATGGATFVTTNAVNGGNNTGWFGSTQQGVYWVGGSGTWTTTSTTNWSNTSGGTAGYPPPTSTTNAFFDSNSGSGTVTINSSSLSPVTAYNLTTTGSSFTFASGATTDYIEIYGGLTLSSATTWTAPSQLFFLGSGTITTNGVSISGQTTVDGVSYTLGSALTVTNRINLYGGTLTLNSFDINCETFFGNSGTYNLVLGSNYVNITNTTGGTVLDTSSSPSITGTGGFKLTGATGISVTRSIQTNSASNPNIWVANGDGTVTMNSSSWVKNLTFDGFFGSFNNAAFTVTGDLTFNTSMTYTGTSTITFGGSGTQLFTSASQFLAGVTIDGVGANVTLQDNLLSTGLLTSTRGTLTLNGFYAQFDRFQSSGSVARGIAFGSNYVNLSSTSTSTIINAATLTNFTPSGTGGFEIFADATGLTRTITLGTTGGTEATSPNVSISSSGGTIAITSGSTFGNLDFTFSANSFTPPAALTVYGSLTIASGMTWTTGTGTITFASTSTGKTITSAGKSLYNVTFNGVGGGWSLQDNLLLSNNFTLTNGTFNANNFDLSAITYSSGGGTLNMGSGTWTATNTIGTPWSNTGAAISTPNTSTIVYSSSGTSALIFEGGGRTYGTLQLGNSSTGPTSYTITGANTFSNISDGRTNAYTIRLPASTTTTVGSWTATGTSGNLLTLNSSTAGTQATLALSGGGIAYGMDYLSIQDINFTPTPSATQKFVWYVGANSTFGTNVSGGALLTSDTTKVAYQLISGTSWTVPSNWNSSDNNVYLIGGGGGGGGTVVVSTSGVHVSGAGGGGGGFTTATNVSLTPSSSVTYAIGAAGTAGNGSTSTTTAGGGGTTSFNTGAYTAGGGGGASGSTAGSTVGAAGTGSTFNGGAGGLGNGTTNATRAGGGGGGSGGINGAGQAGGNSVTTTPGAGGQGNNNAGNYLSIASILYGDGATGSINAATAVVAPTGFGGGGGGRGTTSSSSANAAGSVGTQGTIFILYTATPSATSGGNFFQFF